MKKINSFIRISVIAIFQSCLIFGATAQERGAIKLPGDSARIDCGLIVSTTGVMTFETWLLATGNGIVASSLDAANGFIFQVASSWGQLNVNQTGGGWPAYTAVPYTQQWQHFAFVVDGTDIIEYVNGLEGWKTAWAKQYVSSVLQSLYLGRNHWSATSGSKFKLCDVRVWETARSASEIEDNFRKIVPANSPGLLVNYGFNEQSGLETANRVSTTLNKGLLMGADTAFKWSKVAVVPTNLVVTNMTLTSFDLAYTSNSWDTKWEVELTDADGGATSYADSINADGTKSISLIDLSSAWYNVRVRSTSVGDGAWSAVKKVVMGVSGVDNNVMYKTELIKQAGTITFKGLEGNNNIVFTNLAGALVKQFNSNTSTFAIDASNFAQGMYFVRVNNSTKSKVFKVII